MDGGAAPKRSVVPVSVYLTPIQSIDSKQHKLVREISTNAVEGCSELISYFREVDTKLNTILESKAAVYFPSISGFIQKVQKQFSKKINNIKHKMVSILPQIRGGGAEETELLQILEDFGLPTSILGLRFSMMRSKHLTAIFQFLKTRD